MRFMVIVKASKNSEAGILPSAELLAAMDTFNEELTKAGVMVSGEGLRESSKEARVKFVGDKRIVTDGPFAETKELIAGFWALEMQIAATGNRVGRTVSESHAGRGSGDRNPQVFDPRISASSSSPLIARKRNAPTSG